MYHDCGSIGGRYQRSKRAAPVAYSGRPKTGSDIYDWVAAVDAKILTLLHTLYNNPNSACKSKSNGDTKAILAWTTLLIWGLTHHSCMTCQCLDS